MTPARCYLRRNIMTTLFHIETRLDDGPWTRFTKEPFFSEADALDHLVKIRAFAAHNVKGQLRVREMTDEEMVREFLTEDERIQIVLRHVATNTGSQTVRDALDYREIARMDAKTA